MFGAVQPPGNAGTPQPSLVRPKVPPKVELTGFVWHLLDVINAVMNCAVYQRYSCLGERNFRILRLFPGAFVFTLPQFPLNYQFIKTDSFGMQLLGISWGLTDLGVHPHCHMPAVSSYQSRAVITMFFRSSSKCLCCALCSCLAWSPCSTPQAAAVQQSLK